MDNDSEFGPMFVLGLLLNRPIISSSLHRINNFERNKYLLFEVLSHFGRCYWSGKGGKLGKVWAPFIKKTTNWVEPDFNRVKSSQFVNSSFVLWGVHRLILLSICCCELYIDYWSSRPLRLLALPLWTCPLPLLRWRWKISARKGQKSSSNLLTN